MFFGYIFDSFQFNDYFVVRNKSNLVYNAVLVFDFYILFSVLFVIRKESSSRLILFPNIPDILVQENHSPVHDRLQISHLAVHSIHFYKVFFRLFRVFRGSSIFISFHTIILHLLYQNLIVFTNINNRT